mgnify:CR=1 FL=1
MNEEKKLTGDTEINVGMIENALKCLAGQKACDLCVYDDRSMQDGESTCINLVAEDALDLIHRLKDENAGLKERGENVINMLHETISDQKEEIERLTKRHERIDLSKKEYLDWVREFLTTHTDDEDCQMFDVDYVCGVFGAKIEGTIEYIIDLENQRNELKKQVEVLNREINGFANKLQDAHEERENMQAEILRFEDMKFTQEHCDLYSENETLKQWLKRLNADLENEKNWSKIQTKQAVKDTAKEICLGIVKDMPIPIKEKWLEWFRERYGVEVE